MFFFNGFDNKIKCAFFHDLNNILNDLDALPSGYSYQYLIRNSAGQDMLDGTPYYYPLATRNFIVSLELGF